MNHLSGTFLCLSLYIYIYIWHPHLRCISHVHSCLSQRRFCFLIYSSTQTLVNSPSTFVQLKRAEIEFLDSPGQPPSSSPADPVQGHPRWYRRLAREQVGIKHQLHSDGPGDADWELKFLSTRPKSSWEVAD